MKKRIVALLLALALCSSLMVTAFAETITFSDVPASYWGHKNIMQMAKDGLFKGTTEPVNGVGTFDPEKTMTRAEFVTSVLRAVYPEQAAEVQNIAGKWWLGYYHMALKYGILFAGELENGAMDKPMSRQEMAMVLVRALKVRHESPDQLVKESQIADYNTIGAAYKDYVRQCFSMGLIAGVDAKGTFAPTKSLTRAEAATVLCRLLYEDMRAEIKFEDGKTESKPVEPNKPSGSNRPSGTNKPSSGGSLSGGSGNNKPSGGGNNSGSSSGNNNPGTTTPSTPSDPRDELYGDLTVDEVFDMKEQDEDSYWAFVEWLEDNGRTFDSWLEDNQEDVEIDLPPWEEGGKSPDRYTLEQYLNLSEDMQYAFREYFGSEEAFYAWFESKIEDDEPEEEDDLFVGMELEDFTFDTFVEMVQDPLDQAAFCEKYFGGDEAALFDWLDSLIEEPEL